MLQQTTPVDASEKTERLVAELAAHPPIEAVPALLRLQVRSRRCAAAQRWLDDYPKLALAGLVPFAEDAELGPGIINYLRGLIRNKKQTLVDDYVSQLVPATAAKVREALKTTVRRRTPSVKEHARAGFRPLPQREISPVARPFPLAADSDRRGTSTSRLVRSRGSDSPS